MTTDLITRLEAASGADRELDRAIALVGGWTFQKMKRDRVPYWRDPGVTEYYMRLSGSPTFTASLDACRALHERLLPGWRYVVAAPALGKPFEVALSEFPNHGRVIVGKHKSVAELAWLIAILRASEARHG